MTSAAQDTSWLVRPDERVLVTGANGFIGSRVVKRLADAGFTNIRCLVRASSSLQRLEESIDGSAATIDIVRGNLLLPATSRTAAAGASIIFHLAAGIDKSFAGCFMNSVLATRNLLDAAVAGGTLKRFVNVSSFAVYSTLGLRRGAVVDENTPLESHSQDRFDPYGYAKLKQDEIVREYHERFGLPYVVVRPGAVFGPGQTALSGRVGINTFGVFLHMGGSNRIPVTFVDNCADAIVRAGVVPGVESEVFNVVDDNLPTSRQLLRLYKRHTGGFTSIPVPYQVSYLLSWAWERYAARSQGQLPPRFNRRRAAAEWRRQTYSNQKLKQRLGWAPAVPIETAMQRYAKSLKRT